MKMQWLRMEARIREQLALYFEHHGSYDADIILTRISDIVGEETGRGYETDKQPSVVGQPHK